MSPADAAAHPIDAAQLLFGLVAGGACLVLFASAQPMQAVHQRLPAAAAKAQSVVQGSRPKAAILQRHGDRVDQGWLRRSSV